MRFHLKGPLFISKFLFVSVCLVLVKVTLDPNLGKVATYPFPETISLKSWRFISSDPIVAKDINHYKLKNLPLGQQYQYANDRLNLQIDTYYISDTDGDVLNYLKNYFLGQSSSVLKSISQKQDGKGDYAVFKYQQRAYLTACINSNGPSTVTYDQFFQNRNRYDLAWNRLFAVLSGQQSIRDSRCLWVLLSVPLNKVASQDSYEITLESAWNSWYEYWKLQFPEPNIPQINN